MDKQQKKSYNGCLPLIVGIVLIIAVVYLNNMIDYDMGVLEYVLTLFLILIIVSALFGNTDTNDCDFCECADKTYCPKNPDKCQCCDCMDSPDCCGQTDTCPDYKRE